MNWKENPTRYLSAIGFAITAAGLGSLVAVLLSPDGALFKNSDKSIYFVLGATIYVGLTAYLAGSPYVRRVFVGAMQSFLRPFTSFLKTAIGVQPGFDYGKYIEFEDAQSMLEKYLSKSTSAETKPLSKSSQDRIVETYIAAIGDQISGESRYLFQEVVKRSVSEQIRESSLSHLTDSVPRLSAASSTVTTRGFINLVIGIFFAVGALVVLQQSVNTLSSVDMSKITVQEAVVFVGLRISLALVITLISYFFLSLYKRSLEDVRYYNNELTNIAFRTSAIALVVERGSPEILGEIAGKLVQDDRNAAGTKSAKSDLNLTEKGILAIIDKIPSLSAR